MALPGRGGIPKESVGWLQTVFRKDPGIVTEENRRADGAARRHGVNYIAVGASPSPFLTHISATLEPSTTAIGALFGRFNAIAMDFQWSSANIFLQLERYKIDVPMTDVSIGLPTRSRR